MNDNSLKLCNIFIFGCTVVGNWGGKKTLFKAYCCLLKRAQVWKAYGHVCVSPFVSFTDIYIQFSCTQCWHDFVCIHNNVRSIIWAFLVLLQPVSKRFDQFLNLILRQDVALYLFPVPGLFLPRAWSFQIVHPDNGAAVGIVHCFVQAPVGFRWTEVMATLSKMNDGRGKWTKWKEFIKYAGTIRR